MPSRHPHRKCNFIWVILLSVLQKIPEGFIRDIYFCSSSGKNTVTEVEGLGQGEVEK